MDIADIQIADAGGIVLLTGDFTDLATVSDTFLNANVKITPGAAAPQAKGKSTLAVRVVKGVLKQQFTLSVRGVPATGPLKLNVNGLPVGTVTPSSSGSISGRNLLPQEVAVDKIADVSLQTADGQTVLSAYF
jgi:hypothetical protein